MDGITGSPTLAGVVTGALSGAGYAVFKVIKINLTFNTQALNRSSLLINN